jgi:hypothetical protein
MEKPSNEFKSHRPDHLKLQQPFILPRKMHSDKARWNAQTEQLRRPTAADSATFQRFILAKNASDTYSEAHHVLTPRRCPIGGHAISVTICVIWMLS